MPPVEHVRHIHVMTIGFFGCLRRIQRVSIKASLAHPKLIAALNMLVRKHTRSPQSHEPLRLHSQLVPQLLNCALARSCNRCHHLRLRPVLLNYFLPLDVLFLLLKLLLELLI